VTVVAIPLARAKLVTSERAPLPAAPPPVRKIETKGRVFLAAPRTRAVTALPEPEGLPSRSWRGRHHAAMPEPRRFPPPPVRRGARPKLGRQCFIVAGPRLRLFRGGAGAAGTATLLTRDEARRFAANIAKPLKRPRLDTGFSLRSS
jgi:hypothetical protein